jgi:hypothetical protein
MMRWYDAHRCFFSSKRGQHGSLVLRFRLSFCSVVAFALKRQHAVMFEAGFAVIWKSAPSNVITVTDTSAWTEGVVLHDTLTGAISISGNTKVKIFVTPSVVGARADYVPSSSIDHYDTRHWHRQQPQPGFPADFSPMQPAIMPDIVQTPSVFNMFPCAAPHASTVTAVAPLLPAAYESQYQSLQQLPILAPPAQQCAAADSPSPCSGGAATYTSSAGGSAASSSSAGVCE